jgi:drug/metabolite transporter (DMT)-like permease
MSLGQKHQPLLGAGAIAFSTFLYGFFGILTRTAGFTLPIFFMGWVRDLTGAVLILGPLIALGKYKPVAAKDLAWLIARTGFGVLSFVSSYYAFFFLPIGTAYFMFFGGSVLSGFILGKFLFQEKLNRLKVISLILAIFGLLLIYSISINLGQAGYLWLAFGSGLMAAIWNVLAKKVSDNYSATQLNGLDFLIFGSITLLISLGLGEVWTWPNLTAPWLANAGFLAIFVIAGQLVVYGFKNLDAQRGSLIMLLEIVFGVLLGNWFFHERLSFLSMVGGGLIILAAALPEVGEITKLFSKSINRNSELVAKVVNKKTVLG